MSDAEMGEMWSEAFRRVGVYPSAASSEAEPTGRTVAGGQGQWDRALARAGVIKKSFWLVMALRIDAVPDDIAKLRGALWSMLERHRELRDQFAIAVLSGDEAALRGIRTYLDKADAEIEALYAPYCDALQGFGARVCMAVRDLQASDEPTSGKEN